jgi:hypothetical protein
MRLLADLPESATGSAYLLHEAERPPLLLKASGPDSVGWPACHHSAVITHHCQGHRHSDAMAITRGHSE